MALPLFEEEEDLVPQRQLALPCPTLHQQPSVASNSAAASRSSTSVSKAAKRTQDLLVVLNALHDDGLAETSRRLSCDFGGSQVKAEDAGSSKASRLGPMEGVGVPLSELSPACPHTQSAKTDSALSFIPEGSAVINVEHVVLTNKYGDKMCGQICTDAGDRKLVRELTGIDENIALSSEAAGVVEAVEESDHACNPGTDPVPASDTFSGTITINNQSIVVTIENGVLTLAPKGAPGPLPLIRPKKDTVTPFDCPEPGCSCTFESRQKLKVHLLNHTEDPRPYQCIVEGCGWAFATSYKLKRHLQSHNKQRPHICQFEGCGRRFTTVYNLKAHVKVHEQDNAFTCESCSEKFRSITRLTNHQRVHFEPQRPHRCEYPGCEKTFITFSALFSHNRTHFRETGHFACTYPGCDKTYDKACRLKIHTRSHTGKPIIFQQWERSRGLPLARKGHTRQGICSIPGKNGGFAGNKVFSDSDLWLFQQVRMCFLLVSGCNAKFSARSSLYIHSRKHKQDGSSPRTRCPVASCSKHFSSRSSLKSHIIKCHHLSPDVLGQMETTPSLTPSSELISATPNSVASPGVAVGDHGSFTMDLSMVSSGILTIDPSSSVGTTLVTSTNPTLAKALDPLIMAAGADMVHQHGLEGKAGDVLPPQGTINLNDVQTVSPGALGNLTALTPQSAAASVDPAVPHPHSPSSGLNVGSPASLAVTPAAELLRSPSKVVEIGAQGGAGSLLGCVEVMAPQEAGKVLTQFVFPSLSNCFSPQKDPEPTVSPSSFLVRVFCSELQWMMVHVKAVLGCGRSCDVSHSKHLKMMTTAGLELRKTIKCCFV
uniref:C2H2-type domain-containing protein n=1 Tax=Nothobranchius furzeri TaxID=105023 RepID=A0A8C6LJ17_NOTFU